MAEYKNPKAKTGLWAGDTPKGRKPMSKDKAMPKKGLWKDKEKKKKQTVSHRNKQFTMRD